MERNLEMKLTDLTYLSSHELREAIAVSQQIALQIEMLREKAEMIVDKRTESENRLDSMLDKSKAF